MYIYNVYGPIKFFCLQYCHLDMKTAFDCVAQLSGSSLGHCLFPEIILQILKVTVNIKGCEWF